jgi:hypothetical protein
LAALRISIGIKEMFMKKLKHLNATSAEPSLYAMEDLRCISKEFMKT